MTDYITIERVYDMLADEIAPVSHTERLPLAQAEGAVLAETISAPFDAPAFTNSAMDGFAFASEALAAGGEVRLPVAGASYAGSRPGEALTPGTAMRIMTGAPVPTGADTVIPFERTTSEGKFVVFPADRVKAGANVRLRGEEFHAGSAVIPAGTVLTPDWTGLAASLGRAELAVRRIRVTVFATGDELAAPGTPAPLPQGRIYDANSATIGALLRKWGAEVRDLGILPDDPAAIRRALEEALAGSDFLVASGGLGAGEHDYTNRVLTEMGCGVTHHHVSMRPGKPFSFGRFASESERWFMALPGNPVAAAVSASLFLRRAILLAAGASGPLGLREVPAVAGAVLKGRTGRTDLIRGKLSIAKGALTFLPAKSQSSGMLTTLAGMTAMAVLDTLSERAEAGDAVRCLLL